MMKSFQIEKWKFFWKVCGYIENDKLSTEKLAIYAEKEIIFKNIQRWN